MGVRLRMTRGHRLAEIVLNEWHILCGVFDYGVQVEQIADHRPEGFVEIYQEVKFLFIKRMEIIGIILKKRA